VKKTNLFCFLIIVAALTFGCAKRVILVKLKFHLPKFVVITVMDMDTGKPITGANVEIDGVNIGITDSNGKVRASLSTGEHTIGVKYKFQAEKIEKIEPKRTKIEFHIERER